MTAVETKAPTQERTKQLFVAGLATFYTVFLVFTVGLAFLLLSFIIYAPGTVLFVISRREQNRLAFPRPRWTPA